MHFLARRGTELGELHEASYLQKTDAVHGAFTGPRDRRDRRRAGGVVARLLPARAARRSSWWQCSIAAVVGAFLGIWLASMVGLQVPNSRLKGFEHEIQEGKILLMLDVPGGRYEEIRDIIARTHPEAADRGNEPTVPAFP